MSERLDMGKQHPCGNEQNVIADISSRKGVIAIIYVRMIESTG